jgi:hypothetical protein
LEGTGLLLAALREVGRVDLRFRKGVALFAFQLNQRSARGDRLFLQRRFFEVLHRLRGQLVDVVEKVLAEAVAVQEAQAFELAALTEL